MTANDTTPGAIGRASHRRTAAIVGFTLVACSLAIGPSPAAAAPLESQERFCLRVPGESRYGAFVNLTPVGARAPGHGSLVASDSRGAPTISNVNYAPGTIDPNVAIAQHGLENLVCFTNSSTGQVDLVADYMGSVSGRDYLPATTDGEPRRVVDTRTSRKLAPGERLCFAVSGEPGDGAIVNLTPVRATGPGHGVLISSDVATAPTASNVNYAPGTVDPNLAIAPIGRDGQVCFANAPLASVDLVADHLGTIARLRNPGTIETAGTYTPATPSGAPLRLIDTRTSRKVAPGERVCFAVSGEPGDGVLVNLTPVGATGPGHGVLMPSDVTTVPEASNVNYAPGTIDPNVAITTIGADGRVCYANATLAAVDLVADHLGTLATMRIEGPFIHGGFIPATPSGSPTRLIDTRARWKVVANGFTTESGQRVAYPDYVHQCSSTRAVRLWFEYSDGRVYRTTFELVSGDSTWLISDPFGNYLANAMEIIVHPDGWTSCGFIDLWE